MLHLTTQNFEKTVLASDKPVLVDFFASWCAPCRAMHPVMEELDAKEDLLVGKVDIDAEPELAQRYHILSVPSFLAFQNGRLCNRSVGVQNKEALLALFQA